MARLTKVYFSRFHRQKPHRSEMTLDEIRKFQVDFNGALESETVTSIDWQTDEDLTVSISAATLSAGIASVLARARIEGQTARLYCLATLDTGRKLKQWFNVKVIGEADVR